MCGLGSSIKSVKNICDVGGNHALSKAIRGELAIFEASDSGIDMTGFARYLKLHRFVEKSLNENTRTRSSI